MIPIFNVFKTLPYQRLPTNSSVSTSTSRIPRCFRQQRFLFCLAALACSVVLLVIFVPTLLKRPDKPLDEYQNLNNFRTVERNVSVTSRTERAVVSSLYSDSYTLGAAVLGYSARLANVSARLLLPYLDDQVSQRALCIARVAGWETIPIARIPPPHHGNNVYYFYRDQFTKLNIWSFDKLGIKQVVYLDADTLVRRNFDELFDGPFNFAAVQDVFADHRGFSVNFNAGVLVVRPSSDVLEDMKQKMETAKFRLQGAEQAFLHVYFAGKGVRLPYIYNGNMAIKHRNAALWKALSDELRIIHYTMKKPFANFDASQPPEPIFTPDEQRDVVRQSKKYDNGLFAEEFQWWLDVYEQMIQDKGDEIAAC